MDCIKGTLKKAIVPIVLVLNLRSNLQLAHFNCICIKYALNLSLKTNCFEEDIYRDSLVITIKWKEQFYCSI